MDINKLSFDNYTNIKQTLIIHYLTNVFLAFILFSFDFLSLGIYLLQFCKPHFYSTNIALKRAFVCQFSFIYF